MNIVFCINNGLENWGSTYLRAIEISRKLNEIGYNSTVIKNNLINEVKNSIIIFVKRFNYDELVSAGQKNKIVLDVIDNFEILKNYKSLDNILDGIIFPNSFAERDYKKFFKSLKYSKCIEHHWDTRLEDFNCRCYEFKPGYFGKKGHIKNKELYEKFDFVEVPRRWQDAGEFFKKMEHYNFHYILDETNSSRRYKPGTKCFIAAATGSPVISSKEESYSIYLGEEYPYHVKKNTLDGILETLDYARVTYNTKIWELAIRIMIDVKDKFCISSILEEYKILIETLS